MFLYTQCQEIKMNNQREIELLLNKAHEMLAVAALNLENGFYGSAVNRAYYAIFYAASALLATQGQVRGKHSGVISAFREQFVKTGMFPVELSDAYGRVMAHRESSDYDLGLSLGEGIIEADLSAGREFVAQVESWLKREGWL
jgi:uncharacterized protein (UPF0332 family)